MKLACETCRKKKIKCNRESPCSNCVRASIECIPHSRVKTVRRAKTQNDSLLQRLKQLEDIVSKLGPTDSNSEQTSKSASTEPSLKPATKANHNISSNDRTSKQRTFQNAYTPTSFWISLTSEIAEQVADLLESESDGSGEEDTFTSSRDEPGDKQKPSFSLGFTTDVTSLRLVHPTPDQLLEIWQIFLSNCAPLMPTIHISTKSELIRRAIDDVTQLKAEEEAWTFCFVYLTIVSTRPEQCLALLGRDRDTCLDRFKWACEQALARAGFLLTQDLLLIEAFEIYCVAIAHHINNISVRAMVGLLVNLAHSAGLHRDGEQLGLPPFDVEWRRRLWWGIRTIDLRTSLDYDAQCLLIGRWCDTKFPLNINNDDIWPGMTEIPIARKETTEMSSTLLRWELASIMSEIAKMRELPLQDRLEALDAMNKKLSDTKEYLRQKYMVQDISSSNVPVGHTEWFTARVFEMLTSRLWLLLNQPVVVNDFKSNHSSTIRDKAYKYASTILLTRTELLNNSTSFPWAWLFTSMVDWQSICIVLLWLSDRTEGVDDIWAVVDQAMIEWPRFGHELSPQLAKQLERLYQRARSARLLHNSQKTNSHDTNGVGRSVFDVNPQQDTQAEAFVFDQSSTDFSFDIDAFDIKDFPLESFQAFDPKEVYDHISSS